MVLLSNIIVSDPFNSSADPKMPFLAEAIAPMQVQRYLAQALGDRLEGIELQGIQVMRHKMGRRCGIAYNIKARKSDSSKYMAIIGKVRAKGLDYPSYELQRSLWNAGFGDRSSDGISVPEVLGAIPRWEMWLQTKIPGSVATDLLAGADGVALAIKIAESAHKLHQGGFVPHRCHTMTDELKILRDRLPKVGQVYPNWAKRIAVILDKCDRLGAKTPEFEPCGIHRDFYGDQVIVNGDRLYLIDLDLYCLGNPALDIGNFIAHITEYSLRVLGNPDALSDRESAMTERFVEFHGAGMRLAIESYTTLTLVRHIYISTQISDRRPFTKALLELCEQRLS
ncbi:phosphotransferase family protein [Merismopedia glauca]|uniref:Aminoglycoside phosphotransferase n=1 Tax=Merismopedia glauca CCAP 1448/3 TaxID=1296344 RepID=A0A2T1CA25_9CYAN|nr:phosphotransferase [Merismopedia glauca]PSB05116.1 aminoglycoside phosphotransferase [Merismopedia glauca CCAP 1448/3]